MNQGPVTAVPEPMRYIEVAEPGGPKCSGSRPPRFPGQGAEKCSSDPGGRHQPCGSAPAAGHYPPPPQRSPNSGDGAVGDTSPGWARAPPATGRPATICALLAGGGYAEYCVVPEGQCMAVPAGISLRDAAAIPKAAIPSWLIFSSRNGSPRQPRPGARRLERHRRVAIQIAYAFGARVATTAGTDEKCRFCLGLGAEVAVNYRTRDWAAEVARWAHPHGVDAILDMIGGDYFPKHIDLLATGSGWCRIATSHGSQVTADLRSIMMKRLLITGSTLRSRSVAEKSWLARGVEQRRLATAR